MPADAAVWPVAEATSRSIAEATSRSIDVSLSRIRDCAGLASLMKSADPSERRWLGRQLANVLAALPAAQDELAAQSTRARLPQMKELARQVAMLETVVLELACEHRIEELA
jgi:hypothetical protein